LNFHRHFNRHRRPSSKTEPSLFAKWLGELAVLHMIELVPPSSLFILGIIFMIHHASLIQRAHLNL